jgi:hypothetical protein
MLGGRLRLHTRRAEDHLRLERSRSLVPAAKRSGRVSVVSLALVVLGTRLRWRGVIEERRDVNTTRQAMS